jgi:Protein of unknown function (DUF2971)
MVIQDVCQLSSQLTVYAGVGCPKSRMPKLNPPKRLYKYRAFNVNTLRLLSEAEVYYADPMSFNDPLDSKPSIQIDTDRVTLEKLLYQMLVNSVNKEHALKNIDNHRYMSSQYGDYKTDSKTEDYYKRLLADNVKELLYEELGKRGVLSLAVRWDCPLMWSHYADEHRGLCIEYDMTAYLGQSLHPVDYHMPRSIRISELYDWKIKASISAEQAIKKIFYFAKAPQWRYEREWREIVGSIGANPAPVRVSSIHFGLRCDSSVITALVKLHTSSSQRIKFYAIHPQDSSFGLKRSRVDIEEIEAIGVRSSAFLDFHDVFIDKADAQLSG